MNNTLTVIVRKGCPYCELAIRLLEKKNLTFDILMLGIDFERKDFDALVPGAKTFPQILVDGVSIGGYEDLVAKVDSIL